MVEEERLLTKNHKKPSNRRASLMMAYGLEILVNANKKTKDSSETAFIELLKKYIPLEGKAVDEQEKSHHAAIRRLSKLENCGQAGSVDRYFKTLLERLKTFDPDRVNHDPYDIRQKIIDFIPEMIVRDMMRIKPDLEKCFVDELKECSSDISKLVVQAQSIGLMPVKEMPSNLPEIMAVFRPNILYAGRQGRLSVGDVTFSERDIDGLVYCEIDFSLEGIIAEKQIGILTHSPDGNLVMFTQTSKDSNKAFHDTQTLWQIAYDFDAVQSGTFRTITFNPSYFDHEWFILGSCEQSLDMIGKQCYVRDLPVSTHIAASRYIDIDHLVGTSNIDNGVARSLRGVFSQENATN